MKKLKYVMTIALVMVLLVIAYYYYINRDTSSSDSGDDVDITEMDKILSKDLETNYPKTAREVVALYVSIQKCFYNDDPSDKQIGLLAYKALQLMDEKLQAQNPYDEYYEGLLMDIETYRSSNKTITKTILDKASDVEYSVVKGVKSASINCVYYIKKSTGTDKVKETYILRQDSEENWKIFGYMIAEE